MNSWKYIFTFCFSLCVALASASIFCPPDMELFCYDDLTDIDKCGYPTLLGNHVNFTPIYQDDRQVTTCNVGTVFRTWYVDADGNGILDGSDPQCIQTIILADVEAAINPAFPEDLTIGCLEDADEPSPTWISGPCDKIAYTVDSEEFVFSDGACRKIVQQYTVINWCDYAPEDANWDGSGIWIHTRLVKVMDSDAPMLAACPEVVYEVGGDCTAEVVLTQSATDGDDCPAGILTWQVSVDLWADGTEDYFFGPNEPAPFRLAPTASGELLEVVLPESVQVGNHKVTYKVNDGCSNNASCSTTFTTVDSKPPTPYCINFLSTAFQGDHGPAMIPVSKFDKGSFDNCTDADDLRFSFSSNLADTIAEVGCGMQGPNFFNIYVTDQSGNQDFCEVFMFVLDNGSCDGSFAPQGRIASLDGSLIAMPALIMMDGDQHVAQAEATADGTYQFDALPLMESYAVHPEAALGDAAKVDLADLVLLQRHILGLGELEGYSLIAGDMDADGRIRIADLETMKEHILGGSSADVQQVYVPMYMLADEVIDMQDAAISYSNYHFGFDYNSFTRGNISDLQSTTVSKIVLDYTYAEGLLTLTASEEVDIDGKYLSLPADLGSVLFEDEDLKIFPEGQKIKAGEPLLTVRTAVAQLTEVLHYITNQMQLVPSHSNEVAELEIASVVTSTTGAAEVASQVFPNPTTGVFFIHGEDVQDVQLYGIDGRSISANYESTADGVAVMMDIEDGTYLLTYRTTQGYKTTKVIVIR